MLAPSSPVSCVAAVLAHGAGEVIVVDGQSADRTAERAAAAGAKVVIETARGYGQAMLSGLAALSPTSTIVLFIDGDGSDRPELIPAVLAPKRRSVEACASDEWPTHEALICSRPFAWRTLGRGDSIALARAKAHQQ